MPAPDSAPRGDAIRRIARDDARVTDPSTSAVAGVFDRAATPRSASRSSFRHRQPFRVAGGQNGLDEVLQRFPAWEFDWENPGQGWQVRQIREIAIHNLSREQVQRELPKHK